jgi:hypothetical protein
VPEAVLRGIHTTTIQEVKPMIEYILDGGLFTCPILFVSVVGMAIAIESRFPLHRVRGVNRKMRDEKAGGKKKAWIASRS